MSDKLFTTTDLERAADRAMVAGQIAVTRDIANSASTSAITLFNEGKDEAAVALREFAGYLSGLVDVFEKKQEGLKSKARRDQIADTVVDANLEVVVR